MKGMKCYKGLIDGKVSAYINMGGINMQGDIRSRQIR